MKSLSMELKWNLTKKNHFVDVAVNSHKMQNRIFDKSNNNRKKNRVSSPKH